MSDITYLPDDIQVIRAPLWQHVFGVQFPASGYGKRIPTPYVVPLKNPKRRCRVYATSYYNAVSYWIESRGKRYYLSGHGLDVVSACQGFDLGDLES